MANQLKMATIDTILTLHRQNWSIRQIAATLGIHRDTGLLESLEVRLHEAHSHNLSHAEFLELILQDELAVRADRHLQRRIRAAQFRELRTHEAYRIQVYM